MKFRKKPVVIEAIRFDGSDKSVNEILDWMLERGYLGSAGGHGHDSIGATDGGFLHIDTLEGRMMANQGDWIIRGVKGEFYPCKPDIFEATYDPAD